MELFSIRIQRTFQLVSTPLLFCVERGGFVQVPFHGKTIRGTPAGNPAGGSSRGGTWIYTV